MNGVPLFIFHFDSSILNFLLSSRSKSTFFRRTTTVTNKNAQTEGKKFNFSSLNAFFILYSCNFYYCSLFTRGGNINQQLITNSFQNGEKLHLDLSKNKNVCEIKTPIKGIKSLLIASSFCSSSKNMRDYKNGHVAIAKEREKEIKLISR